MKLFMFLVFEDDQLFDELFVMNGLNECFLNTISSSVSSQFDLAVTYHSTILIYLPKPVLGGMDGGSHLAITHINTFNQTEAENFSTFVAYIYDAINLCYNAAILRNIPISL
jgi:hypothetical protein